VSLLLFRSAKAKTLLFLAGRIARPLPPLPIKRNNSYRPSLSPGEIAICARPNQAMDRYIPTIGIYEERNMSPVRNMGLILLVCLVGATVVAFATPMPCVPPPGFADTPHPSVAPVEHFVFPHGGNHHQSATRCGARCRGALAGSKAKIEGNTPVVASGVTK
jgi:hypothetical protein